jgi:hypothetical protein
MKTIMIALSALAMISIASAQMESARGLVEPSGIHTLAIPPTCTPCLWYAGDSDDANPNWNSLANANIKGGSGIVAQTWVPIVPASDGIAAHKHVLISAITFNEVATESSTNPPPDYTGMTYAFATNMLTGSGGTLGRHGTCPYTAVVFTGKQPYGYNEYSFTCQLGTTAVKVPVGTITWVNLTPEFTGADTSVAYLENAIDIPALNQYGWGDMYWDSFFNSAYFNCKWVPAASGSNLTVAAFSVAIAGTYVD